MLTKAIIIGIVIAITTLQSAFANNFYFGAGLDVTSLNDKQTTSNLTGATAPITHDYGRLSFTGSALGGYGFDFNNHAYLGLEAFFTGPTQKFAAELPTNTSMNVWSRYAYGARILPGYRITPNILGYTIFGLTQGSFGFNDNAYSITSTKFNVYGYQLGLGTAVALLKNLDVRLSFIYTQYANHTMSVINIYHGANQPMMYLDSPATFSGVLSLTYKFV